jgi:hypothetical protein
MRTVSSTGRENACVSNGESILPIFDSESIIIAFASDDNCVDDDHSICASRISKKIGRTGPVLGRFMVLKAFPRTVRPVNGVTTYHTLQLFIEP